MEGEGEFEDEPPQHEAELESPEVIPEEDEEDEEEEEEEEDESSEGQRKVSPPNPEALPSVEVSVARVTHHAPHVGDP